MLKDQSIGTPLPVSDITRARAFYEEVLGFTPADDDIDEPTYMGAGGTWFFLHYSPFAGTNRATALVFKVGDIHPVMTHLRERGVTFEEYDDPGFRTQDGVFTRDDGTKMAWFLDPEGNLLGLGQPPA
jgi:catechol 2,3-dioxygenase-like lactoylglutathione lyase family enzyme